MLFKLLSIGYLRLLEGVIQLEVCIQRMSARRFDDHALIIVIILLYKLI
jgi:hypothetical protein